MAGALDGIRVLEMSVAIQGPAAGLYLAEMGAEVIKIEPPLGDSNRYHRGTGNSLPEVAMGTQFIAMNKGKRSVCIDVHHPLGQRALLGLIGEADVFLSNYREEALQRFGLGYETLHAQYPELIYATVNGFGPLGPDANKAMLDGAAQARGGIVAMTGHRDGPPLMPGAPIADTAGAMQLALGTVTALLARERQGIGQRVQTSALGGQLWLQMWELQHRAMTGAELERADAYHDNMRGPYGVYGTADGGWIMFTACMVDEAWDAFWIFAEDPEVALDSEWATPARRLGGHGPAPEIADALRQRMQAAFARHSTADWLEFLYSQPEIIWERVRDHGDVLSDPQNLANGYVSDVDIPTVGTYPTIGNLVQFTETPGQVRPPPALGQDNLEVLSSAGLSRAEASELIEHTDALRAAAFAAAGIE